MCKTRYVLLALAFSLASQSTMAQSVSDSEMKSKADSIIEPIVQSDKFSGTVLVARNGVPIFRQAYGLANRELNVPNKLESKFRIGSITKQFTAAAILMLQEAGKLSIDDSISRFYATAPAAWSGITIRNLLTHTSGIPDINYANDQEYLKDARIDRTPAEYIKFAEDKPLNFAPGSKFVYDNMGYVILGYIIEKASGESYADYLQHHIFGPLGMNSSGYDSNEPIILNRSSGYRFIDNGYANSPFISMTQPFSAGALYSSANDLLTWNEALQAGKLLNQSSLQAMFTDYGHGYGFGWFVDNEFGHQHFSHGGIIRGFASRSDEYPKDHLDIVVLSNEGAAPVGHIADELAVIYLGIPPRKPAPGGEVLVRQTIEALRAGQPNYGQMGPQMAQAARTHIPGMQKAMANSGAVRSVTLLEADPEGIDRYQVIFDKSTAEWDVRINNDGTLNIYPAIFPVQ